MMFNLFKKKESENNIKDQTIIAVAALLIHSAKIDQNFSNKERNIIKNALLEMGAEEEILDKVIIEAENKEKNSNDILNFTKIAKNLSGDEKKIII